MPEVEDDIMKDVVVRAGIRDRMIADMAVALGNLANWDLYAKAHEFSRGAKGAQEYATLALQRYHETRKKL